MAVYRFSLKAFLVYLGLALALTGCPDQDPSESSGPGGVDPVEVPPSGIDPDFLGTWRFTTLSIENSDPVVLTYSTAIRVSQALNDSVVPIAYRIVVDELEVSETRLIRSEVLRTPGREESSELFSTTYRVEGAQWIPTDGNLPRITVDSGPEEGILLIFSDAPDVSTVFEKE